MQSQEELEDYFYRSKIWYNTKYLRPLTERSYSICACLISIFLVIIIFLVIYKIFPLRVVLRYAVGFDSSTVNRQIAIKTAGSKTLSPSLAIAQSLLENYVVQVEQYDYNQLKNQLLFVQTNSTKYVFHQYYNFILHNNRSPFNRFGDKQKRSIEILSTNFDSNTSAKIKFRSIAKDANNKTIEQILWRSDISFRADPVIIGLPDNTKFHFLVTAYKVTLLNKEDEY